MADQTTYRSWTIPVEGSEPWYAAFVSLMNEVDTDMQTVMDDVTAESIWDRTSTVITPQTPGDTLDIDLARTAALNIDATGALGINSSGGAINIGTDNVAQGILIGTAGARSLTIGGSSATGILMRTAGTMGLTASTGFTFAGDASFSNNVTLAGATSRFIAESGDAQTSPMMSIKQTLKGNITNIIAQIEADGGAYWQSGSACLKLISDHTNCDALIVDGGEGTTAWITNAGQAYFSVVYANTIGSQSGNLTLDPNGSSDVVIGSGHDLGIGTDAEIYSNASAAGAIQLLNSTAGPGNQYMTVLTGTDTSMLVMAAYASKTTDYQSGKSFSNPALVIQSASTTASHYIVAYHNQTNGVISTGAGNLLLDPAVNVEIASGHSLTMSATSQILSEAATTTTSPLLSLVQTMTGDGVNTMMRIEADGTGWGSGSRVLELISDEADAVPFVVNDGAADTFWIERSGMIVANGAMTLRANESGSFTFDSNSAGSVSFSTNSEELFITGGGATGITLAPSVYMGATTETTPLISLKQTMAADGVNTMMKIDADGGDWGSGSIGLEIDAGDDPQVTGLVINGAAGAPVTTYRSAGTGTGQFIVATNYFRIASLNNKDIEVVPNGSGDIVLDGGQKWITTTVSAATYTVDSGTNHDFILMVTRTASGTCAITLPSAAAKAGRVLLIKDSGLNASTYNITIQTAGSENIDGFSTATLNGDGQSLTLFSDGTDWFIV